MNNTPNNQPCQHCGRYNNRGMSIDAVIINDGKILLVKRGAEPEKGLWATPGGYVEWNESTEQTAVREVKEETNLDVKSVTFVGVYSSPARHINQVINVVYLVSVNEGDLQHGDDADDARWFDLKNLPEPLAFDHKQNIADALKMR